MKTLWTRFITWLYREPTWEEKIERHCMNKAGFFILAFFFFIPSAHAAINCDANYVDSGNKVNTNPFTASVTTVAGTNITAVATVYWWGNSGTVTLNSVTYGASSMTFATTTYGVTANGPYNKSTYYLASPPTGANTVTATFSVNSYGRLGVLQMTGTNTSSPVDVITDKYINTAVNSISTNVVTNYANSCIVDVMGENGDLTAPTSLTNSQTTLYAEAATLRGSSYLTTTTAGTYAMAWSWSGANSASQMQDSIIAIRELYVAPVSIPAVFSSIFGWW